MAAVVVTKSDVWGSQRVAQAVLTFDSSYPTGGEAITPSMVAGFTSIGWIQPDSFTDVATKTVRYVPASNKVQLWVQDAISGIFAEAADGSNQSAVDVNVLIFGY